MEWYRVSRPSNDPFTLRGVLSSPLAPFALAYSARDFADAPHAPPFSAAAVQLSASNSSNSS
eukprot:3357247-Pyramimonas_sp.AAC.2